MELAAIKSATLQAIKEMDQAYDPSKHKPVFDEVLLITIDNGKIRLLWHYGARTKEDLIASFKKDFAEIQREIREVSVPGNFHFDNEAEGSAFDAIICVSLGTYLVLNNIELSMEQVKEGGNWLAAQTHFVDLAGKFDSTE
ncbi:MAG: hypothetical protein PHH70_03715 [Candidatus Gracilibacteria bacterium]|nr:hypothetical protein [Candidatus Gracilibacteria bacterium]